jgi:hypothetical protein
MGYHKKYLDVLLAEKILLHHTAADGVVELLVLLKCLEGNRAVHLLEIAEPGQKESVSRKDKEYAVRTGASYKGRTNFMRPIRPSNSVVGSMTLSSPAFIPTWR